MQCTKRSLRSRSSKEKTDATRTEASRNQLYLGTFSTDLLVGYSAVPDPLYYRKFVDLFSPVFLIRDIFPTVLRFVHHVYGSLNLIALREVTLGL